MKTSENYAANVSAESTVSLVLDVGCGSRPIGDVNVDFFKGGQNRQEGDQKQGSFLDKGKIKNFIIADARYLPFKSNCFNLVFSSHTIEHVSNPALMMKELYRVSNRKVVIRCPHKRGSGAKRPFHMNYFDEFWFVETANKFGIQAQAFISSCNYPFTNKLRKQTRSSICWKLLRDIEIKIMKHGHFTFPFEVEAWLTKNSSTTRSDVKYLVVADDKESYSRYFSKSKFVNPSKVTLLDNLSLKNHPVLFNNFAQENINRDCWLIFCKQNILFNENLEVTLQGLDVNAVYGVLGFRRTPLVFGQKNFLSNSISSKLAKVPVQTLDDICLIVHSSAFKKGLNFDAKYFSPFCSSDLCLEAFKLGLGIFVLQLDCTLFKEEPKQELHTVDWENMAKSFRNKWVNYLPVRTSVKYID